MKIKHKVNIAWDYVPPSHVETDDRFLAELETARAKAQRAWRRAQDALARAERRLAAKPDPRLKDVREAAARELEARGRELREIEELMRAPGAASSRAVHRTGREERLDTGVYKWPKSSKQRPSPVVITKRAARKK